MVFLASHPLSYGEGDGFGDTNEHGRLRGLNVYATRVHFQSSVGQLQACFRRWLLLLCDFLEESGTVWILADSPQKLHQSPPPSPGGSGLRRSRSAQGIGKSALLIETARFAASPGRRVPLGWVCRRGVQVDGVKNNKLNEDVWVQDDPKVRRTPSRGFL